MRLLFIACISIISFICNGQKVGQFMNETNEVMSDARGHPLFYQTTYNIEGTPFFPAEYQSAKITLNNKIYTNIKVKINLMDNTMLYDDNGVDMVTEILPRRIEFYDSAYAKPVIFKNEFPVIGRLTKQTYYQVLDSGKITLLKNFTISYKDDKPFNNPVVTRIFEQKVNYYFFSENTMTLFNGKPETLFTMIRDKKNEVIAYINKYKLKLRNEEDLQEIISYYNSL